jgi:hypothetical protein
LFEKITDEASVEALSEQEYRDIHRAVGVFVGPICDVLEYYRTAP